ncbi:hypothetical protein P6F34_gp48 [Pseudomonas phage MiCath]|uniref:Uncharacterized protein n=1 Tax=Pseudomonas phage MiCath TaxID=3003729 RepID=A0AAE9VLM5_9CAUD|nr:hypothetical protein P6F34_gp48 [Pseudomonas phage MiCath]WAX22442.1 hypothetical protein [Pseudomonas phage MiCath]
MRDFLITHQTQPTPISCMTTCLAMLVHTHAAPFVEEWHKCYYMKGPDNPHSMELRQILDKLELDYQTYESIDETGMGAEGVYLLAVPSLNIRGGTHAILAEFVYYDKPDEDGNTCEWSLFDPARGRDGRWAYTNGQGDDEQLLFPLESYDLLAYFTRDSILHARRQYHKALQA